MPEEIVACSRYKSKGSVLLRARSMERGEEQARANATHERECRNDDQPEPRDTVVLT